MKRFFDWIPKVLSSPAAIFIFLFLFVYLVIFGIIGFFVKPLAPSNDMQLILGNYTNVTSALGAAIAAGASTAHVAQMKELHKKHDELTKSIQDLHAKVDKLNKK